MGTDTSGLRMQILSASSSSRCIPRSTSLTYTDNTKYMMYSNVSKGDQADAGTKLPTLGSVATLVTSSTTTASTPSANTENLEVVVYGDGSEFKAAVVSG